jgi:hypothetical protein
MKSGFAMSGTRSKIRNEPKRAGRGPTLLLLRLYECSALGMVAQFPSFGKQRRWGKCGAVTGLPAMWRTT